MPRLYYQVSEIEDNKIPITGEKARYLISVLRCKKGDELTIFDGQGRCFRTQIEKAGRKEVIAKVIETFFDNTESSLHIVLIQGLLKGDKMDLVIQRTTELGVKEIIPALTKRSQLKETRKVNRWRKIAAEASRQSGRSVIPVIHEPLDFKNIFTANSPVEKLYGLIFYEEGGMSLSRAMQQKRMQDESSPVHIFIGPEGGFAIEEIELAKEKGLFVVSFGKRILRAETAAISAVGLVQFLLGDMS
jgi:16S rRNA (uracil1498-N3)-methyltransferase